MPSDADRHDIVIPGPRPMMPSGNKRPGSGWRVRPLVIVLVIFGIAGLAITIDGLFGTAADENDAATSTAAAYASALPCQPGEVPLDCRKTEQALVLDAQADTGQDGTVMTYSMNLSWPDIAGHQGEEQWVDVEHPSAAFVAAARSGSTISTVVWDCAPDEELDVEVGCYVTSVTAGGVIERTDAVHDDDNTSGIIALTVVELVAFLAFRWASYLRLARAFGPRLLRPRILRRAGVWLTVISALLMAGGTALLATDIVAPGVTLVAVGLAMVLYAFFVPWFIPGLLRRHLLAPRAA